MLSLGLPSLKNISMSCKYPPQACHKHRRRVTYSSFICFLLHSLRESFQTSLSSHHGHVLAKKTEKTNNVYFKKSLMSQFKTRSKVKEATPSYTLLAQCFPSVIKSSHARPTGSPWRIQRPASTVPTGHWDVVSLGHSFMRYVWVLSGKLGWFFQKVETLDITSQHVSPGWHREAAFDCATLVALHRSGLYPTCARGQLRSCHAPLFSLCFITKFTPATFTR